MFTLILTTLLGLSTANAAGPHEFNLEQGALGTTDDNVDIFTDYGGGTLGSLGVSYGHKVTDSITVFGAWHRGAMGSEIMFSDDAEWDDDEWDETSGLHIALVVDQISLGARYRWSLSPGWKLNSAAQALIVHGRLKMDDDIETSGNENEMIFGGIAPGMAVTGGLEWLPFRGKKKMDLALGFDLGYGATGAMKFSDRKANDEAPVAIGDMRFNGLFSRIAIGTRF